MKRFIKPIIITCLIIAIIAGVFLLMLKYDVEGEMNMPFNLSRIMIVSSAEGISKQDEDNLWNMDIVQNNDIYLEILKNENYKKQEIIESVTLDKFTIDETPVRGEFKLYCPSENEGDKLYNLSEESQIEEIVYEGSESTNIQKLQIANQGGRIQFRYTTKNLGSFVSNEEGEIKHDGTILQKLNIKTDELRAKVSFDITIKIVSGNSFKARISLEFPTEDLVQKGTVTYEKTDTKDIIFKRI